MPEVEVKTRIATEDIITLSVGLALAGILIVIVARFTQSNK